MASHPRVPSQLTGSPGRVFQAGFGWAMVQPELWAAAALMLLGAAVSLCLKCQLSGKFCPRAPGSCPPPWLGFLLGMSTLPVWICFCSAMVQLCPCGDAPRAGAGKGLCQRAAGEAALELQHPFPGVGCNAAGCRPLPVLIVVGAFGTPPGRTSSSCTNPAEGLGQKGRRGRGVWRINSYRE